MVKNSTFKLEKHGKKINYQREVEEAAKTVSSPEMNFIPFQTISCGRISKGISPEKRSSVYVCMNRQFHFSDSLASLQSQ